MNDCKKIQGLCEQFLTNTGWLSSFHSNSCIDSFGEYLPWYSYAMINFLIDRLPSDVSVFEFGCGYSSLFYAKRVTCVKSVEIKKYWRDKIMRIAMEQLLSNLQINLLPESSKIDNYINAFEEKFDIIVVDSAYRNHCVITAHDKLNSDGIIILDNTERSSYQSSFEFLASKGFRHLNFFGLGPLRINGSQTTVFYKSANIFNI